jgi:pimeloyl-ACP methyl ester carboxylesterase
MSKLTLVLLPGMDGTGSLFEPFISALGDAFEIVVVRYPAHAALGYAALEEIARQALPAQGSYILFGESFSGPITVSLAAARPPGLAGLILCSTFLRSPLPGLNVLGKLPVKLVPSFLHHFFLLGSGAKPGLKVALSAAIDSVSPEAFRARIKAVSEVDVRAQLQRVDVPVLYLQALDDRVVPRPAGREVLELLPAARMISVRAPHCLVQTAAIEAAALIKQWQLEMV